MAEDKNNRDETAKPNTASLPMRKEMEDGALEHKTAGKDINDTFGGKVMHFFTFYVLGWIANASLSLGITYFLNPQPRVSAFKNNLASGISNVLGNKNVEKTKDSVRSGIEMGFMLSAGTAVTLLMTPLVKYRGILAYKINKLFKKDTDVLPQELQPAAEPKTVEDTIEQAINTHVKKHSAWDIWVPRGLVTGLILLGDNRVNAFSRWAENRGPSTSRFSVDTASWGLGKQIYKLLHKSSVGERLINGSNRFFSSHGAGVEDIKAAEAAHYERLHTHGNVDGDNSMVVAEQTRIVTKELGWSLVAAQFLESLTEKYRDRRIHKQEKRVIDKLTRDGVVPEDHVAVVENGHVRLTHKEGPHTNEQDSKSWAKDKKSSSHTEAMESRAMESQPMLG